VVIVGNHENLSVCREMHTDSYLLGTAFCGDRKDQLPLEDAQ
jgi:hypothetical protein